MNNKALLNNYFGINASRLLHSGSSILSRHVLGMPLIYVFGFNLCLHPCCLRIFAPEPYSLFFLLDEDSCFGCLLVINCYFFA